MADLTRKIDFAIKLLRSIPQDGTIELSYSGGKDSDVILRLAQMSGIPFEAIYKNTTIDPPGTIKHCKDNGVTIVNPKKTFIEIVEQNGLPSRFARFCCRYLKEYKIYDRTILGIRRCESTKRAARYKEPERCRVFSKTQKVRQYFPILEWSNNDVQEFIEKEKITCAPVYYDKDGIFHIERRLGCIGCPLTADNGVGDYLEYPKLLIQVAHAAQKYFDNHPDTKGYKEMSGSAYNALYKRLFCRTMQDYIRKTTSEIFPELVPDTKLFLEHYFHVKF